MNRPLVQRVISSPLPVPMRVTKIVPDDEGGLRFYLGPDWHGHYVVIQDEASLELIEKRTRDSGIENGTIEIPAPPPDKFYCERNGHCPCEEIR